MPNAVIAPCMYPGIAEAMFHDIAIIAYQQFTSKLLKNEASLQQVKSMSHS